MSHWKVNKDWYQGSLVLQSAADAVGIQVDKFNYTVSLLLTVLISAFYRTVLSPERVGPLFRKIFAISVGFILLYFCFGAGVIHVIIQSFVSYLLILFCPVEHLPTLSMIFNLSYQGSIHIYRMIYDYGGYTLDVTGALNLLTQRLTTIAFSIRDGSDLSKCGQKFKSEAISSKPDFISYFSYAMDFHLVLGGPLLPYTECQQNINHGMSKEQMSNRDAPRSPPVLKIIYLVIKSLIFVGLVMYFGSNFPISLITADATDSLLKKIFYLHMNGLGLRSQYYFLWTMAEAICVASGFGYRCVDGEHRWDGCSNVKPFSIRFGTSIKVMLDNWNISTQKWLKFVCYDRMEGDPKGLLYTFVLSAFWHGFYPGYYLTFVSLHFATVASRTVRRNVRHYFQGSSASRFIYDVVTGSVALLTLEYLVIPFTVLNIYDSLYLWSHFYYWAHILIFVAIFAVPRIFPKKQKP